MICECYHVEHGESVCYGTKEKDACSCGGNVSKCNFYAYKRVELVPTIAEAWSIVKYKLDDNCTPLLIKVRAIERVARMETMNSVKKDELARALRWLFDKFDFSEVEDE